MIRGLVELAGGWVVSVGHSGQRRVRMLINFDAKRDQSYSSVSGSRTIEMSQREALELSEALRAAATLDVLTHSTGVRR